MIWLAGLGIASLYLFVGCLGLIAGESDRRAEQMARREVERQKVARLASWNRNKRLAVVEPREVEDFIDWRQVSG